MISWSEPSVLKMFIDTFVVFANSGGSFCAKYEFDLSFEFGHPHLNLNLFRAIRLL